MVPREFYEKKIGEVMKGIGTKEVPVIEKSASIEDVLKMLRTKAHTWVVDSISDMKVVGVITEKDFLTVISPMPKKTWVTGVTIFKTIQQRELETAEDLMTKNPMYCKPDDTVDKALDIMRDHSVNRLAVVESKKLVGEITLNSLLEWYTACSLLGRSPPENENSI
jgi:CBS domain-containing protein